MQSSVERMAAEENRCGPLSHDKPKGDFTPSSRRQLSSRLFFSIITLYLITWAIFDTGSRMHAVLQSGGTFAYLSATVLWTLAGFALLDVVLNDIAPKKYSFYLNDEHRYFVWGGIGATYLGYAFVFSKYSTTSFSAGFYAIMGIWAATIAAMDVVHEYRERKIHNAAE